MSSNILISLRPENVIRQLPWRVDSKAALGLLLLLAMFSLVGWLYLTQASAVTATSYRIDALRLELDHIKNQNAALTLEIAQLEALGRVEVRARELGFGPTTDVRYIPVADYPMPQEPQNAVLSAQPSRSSFAPTDSELEQTPWWTQVLDNFAGWLEGRE